MRDLEDLRRELEQWDDIGNAADLADAIAHRYRRSDRLERQLAEVLDLAMTRLYDLYSFVVELASGRLQEECESELDRLEETFRRCRCGLPISAHGGLDVACRRYRAASWAEEFWSRNRGVA